MQGVLHERANRAPWCLTYWHPRKGSTSLFPRSQTDAQSSRRDQYSGELLLMPLSPTALLPLTFQLCSEGGTQRSHLHRCGAGWGKAAAGSKEDPLNCHRTSTSLIRKQLLMIPKQTLTHGTDARRRASRHPATHPAIPILISALGLTCSLCQDSHQP